VWRIFIILIEAIKPINSLQSFASFFDCPSHLLPNNAHAAHLLRRMVVISFAVIDGRRKVGRLDMIGLFASPWRKLPASSDNFLYREA